jgi:hypothetical protein
MKRGTPRHPKTKALAKTLRINLAHAVGLLEMLFHFAAEFTPEGDIGRYPDETIAEALAWAGEVPRLIQALTTTGWIEVGPAGKLVVHDWLDHADHATQQRVARRSKVKPLKTEPDTDALCAQAKESLPDQVSCLSPSLTPSQAVRTEAVRTSPAAPRVDVVAHRWRKDETFARFAESYSSTGAAVIDEDFNEAYEFYWRRLDWEQKLDRVRALEEHLEEFRADPRFVPNPRKFLEVEWKRPLRPTASNAKGQINGAASVNDLATSIGAFRKAR